MKKIFFLGIIILLLIKFSVFTSAYLDPGTGGMIIGSLGPLIITIIMTIIAFLVKYFWNPIKGIFKRTFKILRKKK